MLYYLNVFFLHSTFQTQFPMLLILKKGLNAAQYTCALLWEHTTEIIEWESVVQQAYAVVTAPSSKASYLGLVMPHV